MKIPSVYIHFPFCLRKCNYCDFVSYPVAEYDELRANYLDLLIAELALHQDQQQLDLSALNTIYIGGGTPSLLKGSEVARLLEQLPGATEITLEANPETLDAAKLQELKASGINRLSIGVQSFNDSFLQAMGRNHSGQQAIAAIEAAQAAGFNNIGIDLIFGLPGQTLAAWQADLQQAVALNTQHISLYCLSLEDDTPWQRQVASGELVLPDDDVAATMMEQAIATLTEAGFNHYEISNFAKPGFESAHNCCYWQRQNYLGLGAAAASCLMNCRSVNQKELPLYQEMVQLGELPVADTEILDIEQVIAEALFLGLRLIRGINFAEFYQQYGIDPRKRYKHELKNMQNKGLLDVDEQGMRLSKQGILLGDEVFRAFV